MAGDRDTDRFSANFAQVRLDADARAVLHDEARRLAILDDVDAEPVGGARITPGDRVVPGDAPALLPDAAIRQVAGLKRLRHERQPFADLLRTPEFGVDPIELHRIGEPRGHLELSLRMGKIKDAALAQHHVEIELERQPLIEPKSQVREGDRFGIEVVRPYDGGVAAGFAAAEPALLDHADMAALVGLREVIGAGKPMSAAADNDEIICRLRLRLAPRLWPAFVAGEALAKES